MYLRHPTKKQTLHIQPTPTFDVGVMGKKSVV